MQKIINKDTKILKKEFNNWLLNSFNELKNRERITIWLSWWSSLKIFYEDIINIFNQIHYKTRNKIFFCFLDERVVDLTSDDSNYKQLKDLFLDELVSKWYIKQEQIIIPDFSLKDYETDYFKKVQKIDIWLFWVWQDCHTCSLFPNHPLLKNQTYGYLRISDSPKPPNERITLSVTMLQDIKYSFVFFMWAGKSEPLEKFIDKNISSDDCPIKLVNECENLVIISDLQN
jgi:6-phosphogluconolactonase